MCFATNFLGVILTLRNAKGKDPEVAHVTRTVRTFLPGTRPDLHRGPVVIAAGEGLLVHLD